MKAAFIFLTLAFFFQTSWAQNKETGGQKWCYKVFKSLFEDNDDAERYSRMGNIGYSVVTVHAQSSADAERAADILDEYGAIDVDEDSSSGSSSRQGMSNQLGMGNEMQDQGIGTDRLTNDSQNITGDRINDATVSRVEEELQVGKR